MGEDRSSATSGGLRVAVDIGGTFTDVVVTSDATIVHTEKVFTSYGDLVRAVRLGIERGIAHVAAGSREDAWLVHATTLVSNSYIEGKGAPVSLITTRGFRDSLTLRDGARYDVWDLDVIFKDPLVQEAEIFEITERTDYSGTQLVALNDTDLETFVDQLQESVAVSLLHSHQNPTAERHIEEYLLARRPELSISLASDVSRESGEYIRTTTTVANAFVKPLVKSYVSRIAEEAEELLPGNQLMIMQSSGGLTSAQRSVELPVRIAESGPAAGVTAAHAYAQSTMSESDMLRHIVSMDMGGTTAKIAFVDAMDELKLRNRIEVARDERHRAGSGMPLAVASLDLIEIGAGGGSIARRDGFGLLEVGPESAASEPGPAAFGRGGSLPTVTDANVVLGYIPAWQRLGGVEDLLPELASAALQGLCIDGDTEVGKLALAIHRIANEHMAAALRIAAAERGLQPEDFVLVGFGGGAPLHVCGVAEAVGIRRIVIPPEPGVFSALGLALAPVKCESVRPMASSLPLSSREVLVAQKAIEEMRSEINETMLDTSYEVRTLFDVRFKGQHECLTVEVEEDWQADGVIKDAFYSDYRKLYGRLPDVQSEIVCVRLRATERRRISGIGLSHMSPMDDQPASAMAIFDNEIGPERIPVVQRASIVGASGDGPTLITERHTTTVVRPGWSWVGEADGRLLLEQRGQ